MFKCSKKCTFTFLTAVMCIPDSSDVTAKPGLAKPGLILNAFNPLRPAQATIVAGTFLALTCQALELESC